MTSNEILRLSTFAGEIMLENGAEVWRVEDTMARMLMARKNADVETFVTPTGIFAALDCEGAITTGVRRIKNRTIHLGKVAMVNDFSRKFVSREAAHEISYDDAYSELQRISESPAYPIALQTAVAGIACGCFGYMFGGDIPAAICSVISGTLAYIAIRGLSNNGVSNVLTNLIGSVSVALIALILTNLGFNSPDMLGKTITGAIMPMVPGIAMTNGIRDIVEGDYLSGTSRLTDAILVAVCIATGVGAALTAWSYIFGRYVV